MDTKKSPNKLRWQERHIGNDEITRKAGSDVTKTLIFIKCKSSFLKWLLVRNFGRSPILSENSGFEFIFYRWKKRESIRWRNLSEVTRLVKSKAGDQPLKTIILIQHHWFFSPRAQRPLAHGRADGFSECGSTNSIIFNQSLSTTL